MRKFILFLGLLGLAAPASAEWYRASTRHFVIYSEQKPDDLRRFAQNLERFDGAVRQLRAMDDLPPSQGNRLTIFSTRGDDAIQRFIGDKSGMVKGFYQGRASGSVAFVSRGNSKTQLYRPVGSSISTTIDLGISDDNILFHEYAHHLMAQDFMTPVPRWLIEGFAEFMSTAQFGRDGSVSVGLPATHRYAGLIHNRTIPIRELLAGDMRALSGDDVESLYGRGWLLTHYLTFDPARQKQLGQYVKSLSQGTAPLDAAESAFGNLDKLAADLESYLKRSNLQFLKVDGSVLDTGPIEITQLGPGAAMAMPAYMQVRAGETEAQARQMADKLRAIDHSQSGEALVILALAEAELDAGDPAKAEAEAARVLAQDPKNLDALVLKGKAVVEQAEKLDGDQRHAAFERARATFIAANAIDREDPEPLMEFYFTYAREGKAPNKNAVAALHYAADLAPQDTGLRMNSAMRYLADKQLKDARIALIPVANNPHGGKMAQMGKEMIAAIDAGDGQRALEIASRTAPGQAGE